jgi:hypothetical protein
MTQDGAKWRSISIVPQALFSHTPKRAIVSSIYFVQLTDNHARPIQAADDFRPTPRSSTLFLCSFVNIAWFFSILNHAAPPRLFDESFFDSLL